MRRIDRALITEFVPPFIGAWALFTGVLVFSGVLPSLQYVHRPPPMQVATWLLWQFPAFAVQSMPIAVAFASLLAMGRMVRHRELLAMAAGGVAPGRPVAVLVAFGVALTLVAAACYQWVVPVAAVRVTETWWPMVSGRPALHRLAGHTWFVGTGDLYARRVDGHRMLDVRVTRRTGDHLDVYFAPQATFQGKDLQLVNPEHVVLNLSALGGTAGADVAPEGLATAYGPAALTSIPTTGTEAEWVTRYSGGSYEDARTWSGLWASAHNPLRSSVARSQDWVTIYRKIAEAVANVALLMAAVPLAVRFAGNSTLSFALTLGTSVAWYLALAGTELAARSGGLPPSSVAWLALSPFVLLGLATMAANRRA